MGGTHIAAIAKRTDAHLGAVCTQNGKALQGDFRDSGGNLNRPGVLFDFSAVKKYADWHELVSDSDLDAVDNCLPTDMHALVAIEALKAGKHVLCEKPMALTNDECLRMMEAAEQSGRILMIGQVLRFWPEYMALMEFVKRAEYGAVRQAIFSRRCSLPDWSKWLPDETRSGGALMDLLVHDVDQALRLFGMPAKVAAKRIGSDDAVMATLIYPGGPEVRIQGGWFVAETPFSMSFQVRAERAALELTPEGLMLSDMAGQRRKFDLDGSDGYEGEVNYFVDCCNEGKQPELCMPNESAAAVKVALAIKESRAKDGEQVACLD